MAFIDIDVTKNIKTIDCWMQGEKNAEGVHFDISTWIETYGAGTAYIYIRRNGDETAYFRAMEVTDGVAEWLFSAADTAKAGDGRAQAVYITTDESVVKKTNWYHTVTAESEGDPTGEDPDPYKEMATEVIARMEEAEEELTEEALGEISDAKDAALEDIQDTMFNLAPEFVTTASYSAGDIVLYIGNLYEFTANHAAGAWIGTDVRQITIGGVVADLKEEINDKPNWTVGSAEQLVSDEASATDVTPYTFRRSGGGLIPFDFTREELSKVVGGTVAWNQLTPEVNSTNWATRGVATGTVSVNNDIVSVLASAQNGGVINSTATRVKVTANHVYLQLVTLRMETGSGELRWRTMAGVGGDVDITPTTSWQMYSKIKKPSQDVSSSEFTVMDRRTSDFTTWQMKNPLFVDLTAMLGTTIADYIYSLETATAGSGIAKLREWGFFRDSYYSYDAGSLQSVCVGAHETTGKNLLPNLGTVKTENGITFTPQADGSVLVNGTATATATYRMVTNADAFTLPEGAYIITGEKNSNQSIGWSIGGTTQYATTGSGAQFTLDAQSTFDFVFIRIASGQSLSNVVFYPMIRLASVSDATYVPYEKHTYALDSTKTLRGRFYLDSNNQLRADGDKYLPSGEVMRNWTEIDLGAYTWSLNSESGGQYEYAMNRPNKAFGVTNMVCSGLTVSATQGLNCIRGRANSSLISAVSTISTAADFKTAMNGVKLAYELATPTTETADPYTAVQICDSDGTEEFVDALVEAGTRDVAIPAGTETVYFEDMAGKLAELPPIPSAPTTDGTYTLKAVVSSGSVTYSWQS